MNIKGGIEESWLYWHEKFKSELGNAGIYVNWLFSHLRLDNEDGIEGSGVNWVCSQFKVNNVLGKRDAILNELAHIHIPFLLGAIEEFNEKGFRVKFRMADCW